MVVFILLSSIFPSMIIEFLVGNRCQVRAVDANMSGVVPTSKVPHICLRYSHYHSFTSIRLLFFWV